jgi:hypothetical protein
MSDVPDGSHVEIGRPDVHRAMGKPKLGIVWVNGCQKDEVNFESIWVTEDEFVYLQIPKSEMCFVEVEIIRCLFEYWATNLKAQK